MPSSLHLLLPSIPVPLRPCRLRLIPQAASQQWIWIRAQSRKNNKTRSRCSRSWRRVGSVWDVLRYVSFLLALLTRAILTDSVYVVSQELRVQAYELSGGSPLLSSSPFSLNPSATPFQPFKPLRFLPTASSSSIFPHFTQPAKSSTLRQQPSRKTATLPNRSTARRGTKSHLCPSLPPNESTIAETADPTTSGVPSPSPPPSPLQTKAQSGRVVETDLVLDPTAIPLPQTPPPAFVVPPTSAFTFKNIEVEGSATTTNRDATSGGSRSREETLVSEDRMGKRERSEGDMRGEELALRMLVKVSEVSIVLHSSSFPRRRGFDVRLS